MGFIQLVKLDKYSELFPTMTEFFKPVTKVDKTKTASQSVFNKKRSLDAGAELGWLTDFLNERQRGMLFRENCWILTP